MITLDDVKEMAKRIKDNNVSLNNIKIIILNNPEEAWGESLEEHYKKMKGGYYPNTNTVIVFSDNHESLQELEKTFKHEILGHMGLKMIGEEKKQKIIDSILAAKEGTYVHEAFKKIKAAYGHVDNEEILAEETFSSIAEDASSIVPLNNPTTHTKSMSSKEDVLSVVDRIKRNMHYGYMSVNKEPFALKEIDLLYERFGTNTDEEIIVAAEASKAVYDKDQTATRLLTPISEDELRFYKVTNTENPKIGFRSSFNFDNQGNVIMALKGTSGFKDWRYGNIQGLGIYPSQYKAAAILSRQAEKAFGDKLRITGHSLGGGLATLSSAITNRPAITFNSAGIHPNSMLVNQLDYSKFSDYAEKGAITRCIVKGEILNWIQDHTPLPNSLGLREDLEHPNNPNTFTKHKMQSVEEALLYEIGKCSLRDAILTNYESESIVGLIGREKDATVLEMLKGNKDPSIMIELAKNEHTPLEMLVILSASDVPEVRATVAQNETFPIEALFQMRRDKDSGVQKVVENALYYQDHRGNNNTYTQPEKEVLLAKVKEDNAFARSKMGLLGEDGPIINNSTT